MKKTDEEIRQMAEEKHGVCQVYEGFIEGYKACQEEAESDAVEFAEWVIKEGYCIDTEEESKIKYFHWNEFNNKKSTHFYKTYTILELYSEFKNSKQQ